MRHPSIQPSIQNQSRFVSTQVLTSFASTTTCDDKTPPNLKKILKSTDSKSRTNELPWRKTRRHNINQASTVNNSQHSDPSEKLSPVTNKEAIVQVMNGERIDVNLNNSNPLPFYYNHNSQSQNKNTLLYQSSPSLSDPYSDLQQQQQQQHQQLEHPTAAPTPADIIMQDDQDESLADPNNYNNMNGFGGNGNGSGNGNGNGLIHPVQVQQQQLHLQQAGQYPFSFTAYSNTAATNTGNGVIPNDNYIFYNMNAFNNSNGYNGVAVPTIQQLPISMQQLGQPQNQPMPFRHSYATSDSSNSIGLFSYTGTRTGTGTSTPGEGVGININPSTGTGTDMNNVNMNAATSTSAFPRPQPQPGYKRSYSQTINAQGLSVDQGPHVDASSFNSVVSEVNTRCIKRLCIRDDQEQDQEKPLQDLADGSETEGYASELASSTGPSECATADSASYIALPAGTGSGTGTGMPTGPALNWYELKKTSLKRPHSFLSIDATAGSANTFLSSVGSDEVHLAAVAIAVEGHMRGPPLKRLSTVSIEEMERGLHEQCDAMQLSQENGDGHGEGQVEHVHLPEQDHGDNHSDYKNFNNVLGSLHLERDRRNKEMSNVRRGRSLQTTSGSVSSLTSFSTATGTGTGAAGGQSRWRIPKQVHLQSFSNLG